MITPEGLFCLQGEHMSSHFFCFFSNLQGKKIISLVHGCENNAADQNRTIYTDECVPFIQQGQYGCSEDFGGDLQGLSIHNLVKRQAEDPVEPPPEEQEAAPEEPAPKEPKIPSTGVEPSAADLEDEDYIPPDSVTEIGNPILVNQMSQYLERQISELTGIRGHSPKPRAKKYPVLKLLQLSKDIMLVSGVIYFVVRR